MKRLLLILSLGLTGCFDDTADIREFIADVQSSASSHIPPMPAVPKFNHIEYTSSSQRSPFVLPTPEAIQERVQQVTGCLSPNKGRRKEPLERYSLSNLTMRGTLGEVDTIWALVEASDNTLHRVTSGNYLGMFNGKIIEVNTELVKILELVPDGAGCWIERESILTIAGSSSEGQG